MLFACENNLLCNSCDSTLASVMTTTAWNTSDYKAVTGPESVYAYTCTCVQTCIQTDERLWPLGTDIPGMPYTICRFSSGQAVKSLQSRLGPNPRLLSHSSWQVFSKVPCCIIFFICFLPVGPFGLHRLVLIVLLTVAHRPILTGSQINFNGENTAPDAIHEIDFISTEH